MIYRTSAKPKEYKHNFWMRRKRNVQRVIVTIYNAYVWVRTKAHIWPFKSTSTPVKEVRQKSQRELQKERLKKENPGLDFHLQ